MKTLSKGFAAGLVAAQLLAGTAVAQDLPETNLNVITMFSTLNGYKLVEKPIWETNIPEASGGKVTASLSTLDQLNLGGGEVMRLLSLGTTDVASSSPGYLGTEAPAVAGLDIPGLFSDLSEVRKGVEAYRGVMAEAIEETYNAKLLAVWALVPSMMFCRDKIERLSDLQGKKIRSWSPALNTLFEGLGAVPASVSFAETVPALERGTIDCAPTGILSGNNSRWWEVANNLYLMPIGSGLWFNAINLDRWNALDPSVQAFIEEQMAGLESEMWDLAARELDQGIACNTGQDSCEIGIKANMTVVEFSPEDRAAYDAVVQQQVLPIWKESCGAECAAAWDETVGPLVGLN